MSSLDGIPDNISSIHAHEELLRGQSVAAVAASEKLTGHLHMIERSMDLLEYFSTKYPHQNGDELVIQLLGIRLFNGTASALKLLLSGYYQTGALQVRDLLETAFLLDRFSMDRKLIGTWQADSDAEEFRPAAVRKELDNRDGCKEAKRGKAYKALCKLAGHAHYAGFQLLLPKPGEDAKLGPFLAAGKLTALLEELELRLVEAASMFRRFFPANRRAHAAMKLDFLIAQGQWFAQFYGRPFDPAPIEELQALIPHLPDGTAIP